MKNFNLSKIGFISILCIGFLCMMFSPLVFASAVAPSTPAAASIPSSWVAIGLGILGSGIAFLLVRANTLITAKIDTVKNEGFEKLLGSVWKLAFAKVGQLLQTTINEIKKNSEDGSLTLEDARAALGVAVSEIWQALPPEQQKQLGDAAALPQDKTPEARADRAKELIIAPMVEAEVADQKTPSIVFVGEIITPSEAERMDKGNRVAAARKALQDRLAKARGLTPVL